MVQPGHARCPQLAQHPLLHPEHLALLALRPFRMTVSENVQRAVYGEPHKLLLGADARVRRLAQSLGMSDVDITQGVLAVPVQREGQHVRDLGPPQVPFRGVPPPVGVIHERDRQFATGYPFPPQGLSHGPLQAAPRHPHAPRRVDVDRDQRPSPPVRASPSVRCPVPG